MAFHVALDILLGRRGSRVSDTFIGTARGIRGAGFIGLTLRVVGSSVAKSMDSAMTPALVK